MSAGARCLAVRLLAFLAAPGSALAGAQQPAPLEVPRPETVVEVLVGAAGSFGRSDQSARLELAAARRAGLEAIFWAAADAVAGTGRAVAHFSLDGPDEPLDAGEDWTARPGLERAARKRVVIREPRALSRAERRLGGEPTVSSHAFDREDSRDGTPSLRLALGGSNTDGFRSLAGEVEAERGLHRRSLSLDVRARLFVLPLELSADGRVFAEFRLSEQPAATGSQGLSRDVLHYYLSNEDREVTVDGGTVFLPVPYEPGVWNELELDLSADALAHAAGGRDNLLHRIHLGVESRFQAPVAARFDQLSLEQGVAGPAALERQADVLRGLGGELGPAPALRLLGLQSDLLRGPALLELGANPLPTDYGTLFAGSGTADAELEGGDAGRAAAWAALVDAAHGRGSLVACGNPLAPPPGESIQTADWLAGADLVLFDPEPDDLARQLALWDQLAGAGRFPVALGAGGELGAERTPLMTGVRGLAGFVLAAGAQPEELLDALARGRAAFGDPAAFRGGLDLESERGFAMGQVVLTDRPSATVSLKRLGAPAEGEELDWYTARGRGPSFRADAPSALTLEALPDFARAVVIGTRARPLAFSNALHFVRAFPPGGLPAERAAFDVAGVRSRSGARLRLFDVRASAAGRGVVIAGRASGDGTLVLSLGAAGRATVAWDGLSGALEQDGELVRLRDLAGDGTVTVLRAP